MGEARKRATNGRPYETDFLMERIREMAQEVPEEKAEWIYWVLVKAVYG